MLGEGIIIRSTIIYLECLRFYAPTKNCSFKKVSLNSIYLRNNNRIVRRTLNAFSWFDYLGPVVLSDLFRSSCSAREGSKKPLSFYRGILAKSNSTHFANAVVSSIIVCLHQAIIEVFIVWDIKIVKTVQQRTDWYLRVGTKLDDDKSLFWLSFKLLP